MFTQQIAASIDSASLSGLDQVARDIWKAYAAGVIGDTDTETLSTAIDDRRRVLRGAGQGTGGLPQEPLLPRLTRFPPRRKQVSPDQARSRQRRRHLAASGPLPPALAAKFTTGELAVLFIVAAEISEHGLCDRSYDEIAARAGCCRDLARRAIRLAARFQLLTIELRPRPGRKHLPNVVRIVDASWRAWLRIGRRLRHPTGISFEYKSRDDSRAHSHKHPKADGKSACLSLKQGGRGGLFQRPPRLPTSPPTDISREPRR